MLNVALFAANPNPPVPPVRDSLRMPQLPRGTATSPGHVCLCPRLVDEDQPARVEIGLRVLLGGRQACVTASDHSPRTISEMAARAVAMARAPKQSFSDAWSGLVARPGMLRLLVMIGLGMMLLIILGTIGVFDTSEALGAAGIMASILCGGAICCGLQAIVSIASKLISRCWNSPIPSTR